MRNLDVNDLDIRVAKFIPSHLSYACRFWAHHIQSLPVEHEILEIVEGILSEYFLSWLEVLSVIRAIPAASLALNLCLNIIKV